MSSITSQQTKLDLELVPNEKRFEIGKCNRRLTRGMKLREPTFQVVLDAITLTPCYPAFLITADVLEVYMHQFWNSVYKHDNFYRFKLDKKKRFKLTLEIFRDIFQICPRVQGRDFDVLPTKEETVGLSGKTNGLDKLRLSRAQILWGMYHQKNVDYMELLWEDFIYQINNRAYKKQDKMYYPRFTKVIIHHFLTQDKTLSWRNKIGMHTSKNDYLITTLRFVSAKEATQTYGAVLPECLTNTEMKETKAYKIYMGFSIGSTPPKPAWKFKKASPSKKDQDLVLVDEEPVKKGKRVKRPVKKSKTKPASGIVIREAHVETKSKRKEKVDVTHGKGIELLSEVDLTEDAQFEEVRRKSMRDFHKTHPSGSGDVKIKPSVTSEGTGVKPGVPDVTKDDSTKSETESWGNDEDNNNDKNDSVSEGNDKENESVDDETDNEKGSDSKTDTDENNSDFEYDTKVNKEEIGDDEEEKEDQYVRTPSHYSPTDDDDDETNVKSKVDDKAKGVEEEEVDCTGSLLNDDVDERSSEPIHADEEVIHKEGVDAEMTKAQQGNENLEITQE
ncbi:hypothetical protein Tco_1126253 [Tanacetum coccineum]